MSDFNSLKNFDINFIFYGIPIGTYVDWDSIYEQILLATETTLKTYFNSKDPIQSFMTVWWNNCVIGFSVHSASVSTINNSTEKTFVTLKQGYRIVMNIATKDEILLRILEESIVDLASNCDECQSLVLDSVAHKVSNYEFKVFIPINYATTNNRASFSFN